MGKRTSLQCTYYFEVSKDYTDYIDTYAAGVYSAVGYMGGYVGWQNRLAIKVIEYGVKVPEVVSRL